MRAVLYVRLSKEDRAGKNEGIDSTKIQTTDGTSAIRDQGWQLHSVIIDDDVSGTVLARDGLTQIRDLAKKREIDVVVVRDLDRFSRLSPARTMALLQELADCGVRVWTYQSKSPVELSGMASMMTFVQAISAEAEAKKASERVKAALAGRARDGRAVKRAPYGYTIEDRGKEGLRWAIVDAKAAEVIRIAELTLQIGSKNGAVNKLNELGIRAPAGGPWRISSLTKVLAQPLYRGVYHHAGETILHPELRIFDPELEARVDAFLAKKSVPWGSTPRHLSTRFVRCGVCSGCLVATMSARSAGFSLVCDLHRQGGCEGIGYRAEPRVDAALLSAVGAVVTDAMWGKVKEVLREALEAQRQADKHEAEVERLRREVQTAERRIRSAEELVLDSEGAERETHRASLRAELQRVESLKARLRQVEATATPATPEAILDEAERRVHQLRDALAKGGIEAMPAVQAIMGNERFKATKIPEGWKIKARISTANVYEVSSTQRRSSGGNYEQLWTVDLAAVA
jgi:DNA invertase Pin-like site-specific DNA recombinase